MSDRIGSRLLSSTGLLVSAAGLVWLTRLDLDTGAAGIVLRLLTVGIGTAVFQSPNSSALMGSVPRHRLGIASGMVAMARNVGIVLGVSLAAVVLAVRQRGHLLQAESASVAPELAARQAFLHAAHDVFWVAFVICLLGVVASLVRGSAAGELQEQGERDVGAAATRLRDTHLVHQRDHERKAEATVVPAAAELSRRNAEVPTVADLEDDPI